MINLNEQLDKIIAKQFKEIKPLLDGVGDGEQKDFIVSALAKFKETRTLDPNEFIEGFAKIKGEEVDIEKLKQMVKNNSK